MNRVRTERPDPARSRKEEVKNVRFAVSAETTRV
jgi:hypothetical protein